MTQPFAIGTRGQRLRLIITTDADHAQELLGDGEVAVPLRSIPPGPAMIDKDGDVVDMPDGIDALRAAKWDAARAYRDARQNGACPTPLGVVQIDDASKLRINGAVNMAMLAQSAGQDFTVNWTMADNAVVALDAQAMLAVGLAVGRYVAACQDAGSAVRDRIGAAADQDALEALDITQGYPAAP